MPVLPDEDDSAWNNNQTWQVAYLFVALGDIAATRKLLLALPLLIERASYGDPGEMMSDLCHQLEEIVAPDLKYLIRVCTDCAQSPRPGARLWALFELGRLCEFQSLQTLIDALQDEKQMVREQACASLGNLCYTNPDCREETIKSLQNYSQNLPPGNEKETAIEQIEYIKSL